MALGDFFSTNPATTTQTQNSTTTANPWAPAAGLLTGLTDKYGNIDTSLTGQQKTAGTDLWNQASSTPSYGAQGTGAVNSLFNNMGMIPSAYSTLQNNFAGIANPANLNPYQTPGFSDALSTLTNNITNSVKGTYAAAGRAPSGAGTMPQTLARGLMQGEAPILQSQYNTNVGSMMGANSILQNAGINTANAMSGNVMSALQAAGILPQVSMAPGQAQWGVANQLYSQPISNVNQVLSPAATLGGMGGTTNATGTSTGQQYPASNAMSNILGAASGGLGIVGQLAALSDRRLKTDIKDIGRTHDNQKIYSYRFKGSATPQVGMMADEVEKTNPHAVTADPTGFKRVRYDLATRKAAKMGMLAAA
jgi:hypothetical protein